MLLNLVKDFFVKEDFSPLTTEHLSHAKYAYPSNHAYTISQQKLIPKRKLAERYQRIQQFFPEKIQSFAEVGSSKGFFVFSASNYPTCKRSMGIDLDKYNIQYCKLLKKYLKSKNTAFRYMQLHELAHRIDEFGGPFQTVLVINTYQYLYFGSDLSPLCYLNHDEIFRYLRTICYGRIIFNNRIELSDVQNKKQVEEAPEASKQYSEIDVLRAATKYFAVSKQGFIGRYPLWTLDAK